MFFSEKFKDIRDLVNVINHHNSEDEDYDIKENLINSTRAGVSKL